MKSAPAVCAALLTVSLSACHSNSQASSSHQPGPQATTPASTPPIANPCALASVDEVSAVMGRRTNAGELRHAFDGNRCNFYDASSQYEVFLQTVDWSLAGPMRTPQNTLPGIGDQAYWSYGAVYVLKGSHAMMIGFQLPHVLPALTPPAEKFARLVASRM